MHLWRFGRSILIALSVGCGTSASAPHAADTNESSAPEPIPVVPRTEEHIAALEHARGSWTGFEDPHAAALIEIGEPALPALIDCFEHDQRMTQIPDDFGMLPSFLDVSTFCLHIAEAILDEPNLAYREGGNDRHAAANLLRAYLARYGAMTPVERRVAMLTDPATSDRTAAIAARWLTRGDGALDVPSAIDFIGHRRHIGTMRGASLRNDPAIALSTVMLSRATRALDAGQGNAACEIASSIVLFEPTAEPRLLPLGRSCLASRCPCSYAFVGLVAHDEPAAAVRFLDEHGTTLLASDPFSRGRGAQIARALDVPEVRANVDARLRAIDVTAALDDALRAPPPVGLVLVLLAWNADLPSARSALDRALEDSREIATITPDPGADGARVHMPSAEYTTRLPEPITAPESLRVRDLVANTLALELGTPFSLGWPEARRDEGIATIRARLR